MVYFLSDCHLGAGYIVDPRAQEKALAAWLDSIAADASALYLLGDIIDYWFEYRNVVPRGYTRFLGALARLADKGVEIVWLKGNHDIWMTDYLTSEIGCRIVDGLLDTHIAGRRFVMEHGDGVGRRPLAFRALRRIFRSSTARVLYAAIHPRWTVGFAHSWSRHSRKKGGYSGGLPQQTIFRSGLSISSPPTDMSTISSSVTCIIPSSDAYPTEPSSPFLATLSVRCATPLSTAKTSL